MHSQPGASTAHSHVATVARPSDQTFSKPSDLLEWLLAPDSGGSVINLFDLRCQDEAHMDRIFAAPPVFLSRVARGSSSEALMETIKQSQAQQEDAWQLLPLLARKVSPPAPSDGTGFDHAGMDYLLGLKFEEGRSGIICSPFRQKEAIWSSREEWSESIVKDLVAIQTITDAQRTQFDAYSAQLWRHSMDQHDYEVFLEHTSARNYANIAIASILGRTREGPLPSEQVTVCIPLFN